MTSLFPVRCLTCGKVINNLHKTYLERKEKGDSPYKILDDFGLDKMCCRRMFFCDISDKMEKLLMSYGKQDRIIEVGVGSITFQESRKNVEEMQDDNSDDSEF